MGETERSTTNGRDGWMPALGIPDDAEMCGENGAGFQLQSRAGPIAVDVYAYSRDPSAKVRCIGPWPALLEAGLVSPDWLVEDRRSWSVVFSSGSPQVRIGVRGPPKGRYLSILRTGKGGDLQVMWRVTPDETASYRVRLEELWRRSGSARVETTKSETAGEPWPVSVAHECLQERLSDALAWWKERIDDTGCRYTDDSQHRIDRAIEALRRAVADGNVEEQPRTRRFDGQRIGNVVCWPGRGSVAAVDPAALH